MKLAEALLLRGDVQKKLIALRERIKGNALVQEGDTPQEDPNALYQQACALLDELERLVAKINRTNITGKLADGRSLMEAIAHRDALTQQHSILQAAIEGCKQTPNIYSVREVKWVPTMKLASLQRQADDVSKNLRDLNARIQEANWNVELEAG